MQLKTFCTGVFLFFGCCTISLAQDIISTSPIVLPASPQTTYTVSNGSIVNIISAQSITFNPGTTLSPGAVINSYINPSLVTPPPSNPSLDKNRNWLLVSQYDENGNEVGAQKTFFDNSAKPLQSQVKNESTAHILANQMLYDVRGRNIGSTLLAPTNNSAFAYKSDFVTSGGAGYSYLNFDGNPATPSAQYSKLNNPDPLDNNQQGSLGWYYSNNNSLEPGVAATSFPYQRMDFYRDGTELSKRGAGVDALKMGSGHEVTQTSGLVQNELYYYLLVRNKFFSSSTVGNTPTSLAGQALQTISTNEDGLKTLTVTDLAGNVLMNGRADPQGWLTVTNTLNMNNVPVKYLFDITVDGPGAIQGNTNDPQIIAMMHASIQNFKISSPYTVTVTCLNCGLATWTGIGNDYSSPVPSPSNSRNFRITSQYPFYITASNSYGSVYDQTPARITEPSKSSTAYFQLTTASPVTVTGNVSLYEMAGETQLTNFTNGNSLSPGYYKVVDIDGDASVTYTNKYSDITYYYYNHLGQLIETVAPNGVQALIGNLTSYSTIPFGDSYEYDLQGRLIAATSTDGGRSEFIYRDDGKIWFSQNSVQRVATPGRFSYTNYDKIGRPLESGEYIVSNGSTLSFNSIKSSASLQESLAVNGDLAGGAKQFQSFISYDKPASNLVLPGYVQDLGNLKSQISLTSNQNCTTWYNYDELGRITWTVKQLAGLSGFKTVDYAYNSQGNVIKVDYQKGTSSERFIHYYAYDADTRLVNVQTSRDDISRLQQAKYYYYLHGPLKRTELAGDLQGMDYLYTSQGWLKSINTPTGNPFKDPYKDGTGSSSFAKDAFGMQIEYFPNDYSRDGMGIVNVATGQQFYTGIIGGIGLQSNKPAANISSDGIGILNPSMYVYNYDPKNQLNAANWGTPNYTDGSFTGNNKLKEYGINYDANGNIKSLQRTKPDGSAGDDFSKYDYGVGTNKLISVGNVAGNVIYGNYTYNELGQLTSQTYGSDPLYLKYDVGGNIAGVYSDISMTSPKVIYTYDESGNRITMKNQSGTTYYVYDVNGNVIAIYLENNMIEVPVFASSRIGTYNVMSGNYVYELKDNVGSVRVVINRAKTAGVADILQYNDYYPFGATARSGGAGYRYEYQGSFAEKDKATGWNNFALRMYDGKIGRWLSVDPVGQYWSPYLGMGNNPVKGFDPTGAESVDWYYDNDGNLVFDPLVHSQESLNALFWDANGSRTYTYEGKDVMGKESGVSFYGDKDGVKHYLYNLMSEVKVSTTFNSPDATVNGFGINATEWIGAGFNMGWITDRYQNSNFFMSYSGSFGYGASGGFTSTKIYANKGVKWSNNLYAGTSATQSAGAGIISFSRGGDNANGWSWGNKGLHYREVGGAIGQSIQGKILTNPKAILNPSSNLSLSLTWSSSRTFVF